MAFREHSAGSQETWFSILALLLAHCVTWGTSFAFLGPGFPHL